jgi:hypothetical protein
MEAWTFPKNRPREPRGEISIANTLVPTCTNETHKRDGARVEREQEEGSRDDHGAWRDNHSDAHPVRDTATCDGCDETAETDATDGEAKRRLG